MSGRSMPVYPGGSHFNGNGHTNGNGHGVKTTAPAVATLVTLGAKAKTEYAVYRTDTLRSMESARVLGSTLTRAKDLCLHGEWLPWLKENKIPIRTAQKCMEWYEEWDGKCAVTAHLHEVWCKIHGNVEPKNPDTSSPVTPSGNGNVHHTSNSNGATNGHAANGSGNGHGGGRSNGKPAAQKPAPTQPPATPASVAAAPANTSPDPTPDHGDAWEPPPPGALLDGRGEAVPPGLRDVFADTELTGHAVWLEEAHKYLLNLRAAFRRLEGDHPLMEVNAAQIALVEAADLVSRVRSAIVPGLPFTCPKCEGSKKVGGGKCPVCKGGGHVPQWLFAKAAAEAALIGGDA